MEAYVCKTCGVQQAPSEAPPARCAICEDERQWVPTQGQQWTSLAELRQGRRCEIRELEPGLLGVGAEPAVGIGQRAILVRTPEGNLLWDCIGFIDDAGVAAVRAQGGGLRGIAMSHPHFYGVCVEWSRAFNGAPIHIPAADREWVMRPDPAVTYWEGTLRPLPGITLIQCGGHFEGSAVLHWAAGAEGRGALLTGDSITVTADRRYVTFMRSYPNLIPLSPAWVQRIVRRIQPYRFDRIYGGWWDRVIDRDGEGAVARSVERYLRWVELG